jgi:hypothetical protein
MTTALRRDVVAGGRGGGAGRGGFSLCVRLLDEPRSCWSVLYRSLACLISLLPHSSPSCDLFKRSCVYFSRLSAALHHRRCHEALPHSPATLDEQPRQGRAGPRALIHSGCNSKNKPLNRNTQRRAMRRPRGQMEETVGEESAAACASLPLAADEGHILEDRLADPLIRDVQPCQAAGHAVADKRG